MTVGMWGVLAPGAVLPFSDDAGVLFKERSESWLLMVP